MIPVVFIVAFLLEGVCAVRLQQTIAQGVTLDRHSWPKQALDLRPVTRPVHRGLFQDEGCWLFRTQFLTTFDSGRRHGARRSVA